MYPFNVITESCALTEARTNTRLPEPGAQAFRFARRIALRARRKQARQLGDL